jgi:uncharacterized integral membrane protein
MFGDDPGAPSPGRGGPSPRLVVGGLVVAGVVAFVAQNTDQTAVTWLVFETTQPLWVVLLVTAAATLLGAELVTGAYRRWRGKD